MNSLSNPAPVSLDTAPLVYMMSLTLLMIMASLALGQLIHFWFESRIPNELRKREGTYVFSSEPQAFWTARRSIRTMLSLYMLAFFLGSIGDIISMLALGEVSTDTQENLFVLDRILDTLAGMTMISGSLMWAYCWTPVIQRLSTGNIPLGKPTTAKVLEKLKVIGLCTSIAALVTIGKVGM